MDQLNNQANVAEAGDSTSSEVTKVLPEASAKNSQQRSLSLRDSSSSRQLRRLRSNRLTLLSIDECQNVSESSERIGLSVHLQWDIHDPVSSHDRIALYNLGEYTLLVFLVFNGKGLGISLLILILEHQFLVKLIKWEHVR